MIMKTVRNQPRTTWEELVNDLRHNIIIPQMFDWIEICEI